MKNFKALALTALAALTMGAPAMARPASVQNTTCTYNGVAEACNVKETTDEVEVTYVSDGKQITYVKYGENGQSYVLDGNNRYSASFTNLGNALSFKTQNGTTTIKLGTSYTAPANNGLASTYQAEQTPNASDKAVCQNIIGSLTHSEGGGTYNKHYVVNGNTLIEYKQFQKGNTWDVVTVPADWNKNSMCAYKQYELNTTYRTGNFEKSFFVEGGQVSMYRRNVGGPVSTVQLSFSNSSSYKQELLQLLSR